MLSLAQLQAWAHDSVGPNAVDKFVFLSKGFYYAHCSSLQPLLQLITQQMVRGAGFYAHRVHWDPDYDVAYEYMTSLNKNCTK